jgi:hypothetical protein
MQRSGRPSSSCSTERPSQGRPSTKGTAGRCCRAPLCTAAGCASVARHSWLRPLLLARACCSVRHVSRYCTVLLHVLLHVLQLRPDAGAAAGNHFQHRAGSPGERSAGGRLRGSWIPCTCRSECNGPTLTSWHEAAARHLCPPPTPACFCCCSRRRLRVSFKSATSQRRPPSTSPQASHLLSQTTQLPAMHGLQRQSLTAPSHLSSLRCHALQHRQICCCHRRQICRCAAAAAAGGGVALTAHLSTTAVQHAQHVYACLPACLPVCRG